MKVEKLGWSNDNLDLVHNGQLPIVGECPEARGSVSKGHKKSGIEEGDICRFQVQNYKEGRRIHGH